LGDTRRVRTPLDSLAPARRRQALVAGGVVLLVVLVLAAWGVVRAVAGRGAADQGQPGPVILVPGYGGNTTDLAPLVDELQREGRVTVVYRPTGQEQGDLRVQARRLADLAQRTIDRTGASSVDVIGYSAGGVIARLFVRDDGGEHLVRRVLTLGSPHHGADLAQTAQEAAGGCPTACEQLAPGSDLLNRLNAGDETPSGPRWITIRSDADAVVTPTSSAALAGALNLRIQDFCQSSRTSHGGLPGDAVTLAALPTVLGQGTPRAPAPPAC